MEISNTTTDTLCKPDTSVGGSGENGSDQQVPKIPAAATSTDVVHIGIVCDLCDNVTEYITGCRYKCLTCEDFDVCQKCMNKLKDSGAHPHQFEVITNSAIEQTIAPVNNRKWWLLVHKTFANEHLSWMLPEDCQSLDCLKGHSNYDDILSEFILVSAAALHPEQVFFASSYQHANAHVEVCDCDQNYYLTQNYTWFLKKLQEGMFAWVDVLCIAPAGHTLPEAFKYMGDLYNQSVVIADYLQHPKHWFAAEKRGWIYQESAFTALSSIALDKEAWSTPLGMIALCKLCQRRGLWDVVKKIGKTVADHLMYETEHIANGVRSRLMEPKSSDACTIDAKLGAILDASEYKFNPHAFENVWKNVCSIDSHALDQYCDMHPVEFKELNSLADERWGHLAISLVHHCMCSSSFEEHQATSLLLAYSACDLYDEDNRDVAVTGLAAACLNKVQSSPMPELDVITCNSDLPPPVPHGEAKTSLTCREVLLWCWEHVPADTDIFVKIQSSTHSLLGLGQLYLQKDDDTVFTGVGLVLRGQAGNSANEGLYVSVTMNGTLKSPTHLQVWVNATKMSDSGGMEWLDEPSTMRCYCFDEAVVSTSK